MGVRNLRAICPNCGAKIHTQAKGLGHVTWGNSWFNAQTGRECPYCHVALTGKVTAGGKAELDTGPKHAPHAPKRYRVTTPEGESKVFDTWTEAMVYQVRTKGELTPIEAG
jgi:hypothetical protein